MSRFVEREPFAGNPFSLVKPRKPRRVNPEEQIARARAIGEELAKLEIPAVEALTIARDLVSKRVSSNSADSFECDLLALLDICIDVEGPVRE